MFKNRTPRVTESHIDNSQTESVHAQDIMEARIAGENKAIAALEMGTVVLHGSVLDPTSTPNDIDVLYAGFGNSGYEYAKAVVSGVVRAYDSKLPVDLQNGSASDAWNDADPKLIVPSPWGTEAPYRVLYEGKTPVHQSQIDRLSSAVRGEAIADGALQDWVEYKRSNKGLLIIQLGSITVGSYYPNGTPDQTLQIEDEQTIRDIITGAPEGAYDTTGTIRKAVSKHTPSSAAAVRRDIRGIPAGDLLLSRLDASLLRPSGINNRSIDRHEPTHMILNFGGEGPEYIDLHAYDERWTPRTSGGAYHYAHQIDLEREFRSPTEF